MMMRKRLVMAVVLIMMLIVSACSNGTDTGVEQNQGDKEDAKIWGQTIIRDDCSANAIQSLLFNRYIKFDN